MQVVPWTATVWLLLTLTGPVEPEAEGRTVHLTAHNISFVVLEPSDWKLDLRSAPQLAAFILHPAGLDWRKADTVIYANLLEREAESLKEFLEVDRDRFQEGCTRGETSAARALGVFMVQQYSCPGIREEVMAAAEVGDFYFVLLLSVEGDSTALEKSLPVFEQVVKSFRWRLRS